MDIYVDHFNTMLTGGAAIAARRIHNGLREVGIQSKLWHAGASLDSLDDGLGSEPWAASKSLSKGERFGQLYRKVAGRLQKEYYRIGRRKRSGGIIRANYFRHTPYLPSVFRGNIVHLHWIGKFIDYKTFFGTLPQATPVIWTLHDMHPLTGICSHAEDCTGFTATCGKCPLLARPGSTDLSFQDLAVKKRAIENVRMRLVAPSHWMAEQARKSSLMHGVPVDVIRNPIDLSQFRPMAPSEAKRCLGIDPNFPCVLYVSHSVKSKAKGIDEYLGVLSRLRDIPNLTGIVVGRGRVDVSKVGVPVRFLGYIRDTEQQRIAYSAADVFVMPSHAETISQTIVEAFACNTPTVAFNVGGIPDLVHDDETGFLVPFCNVDELAAKTRWLIESPGKRDAFARNGARLVRQEFSNKRSVQDYLELYGKVLAD